MTDQFDKFDKNILEFNKSITENNPKEPGLMSQRSKGNVFDSGLDNIAKI